MPLNRRLPKRGFVNIFRTEYRVLNVEKLNSLEAGTVVTPDTLLAAGLVRKGKNGVKVLGDGELTKKLLIDAAKFSKSASQKIEAAGGEARVIR